MRVDNNKVTHLKKSSAASSSKSSTKPNDEILKGTIYRNSYNNGPLNFPGTQTTWADIGNYINQVRLGTISAPESVSNMATKLGSMKPAATSAAALNAIVPDHYLLGREPVYAAFQNNRQQS